MLYNSYLNPLLISLCVPLPFPSLPIPSLSRRLRRAWVRLAQEGVEKVKKGAEEAYHFACDGIKKRETREG